MPVYDPETPPQFRPPVGMYRVVELREHTTERIKEFANRLADGDLAAVAEYRDHPLRCIVGDFSDFGEASRAVDGVRYPYRREMFNDMGVSVMFAVAASGGAVQAGPES